MKGRTPLAILLLSQAMPALHAAEQTCYGPGDIDRDGKVNLSDHAMLRACLGGVDVTEPPPDCELRDFIRADLEGDNDVDMADFRLLADSFGGLYFDYGPVRDSLEAEMLAMEVSGQLRAPDEEYNRILGDLALIRAAHPDMLAIADIRYMPNQLLVSPYTGGPEEGYEALNEYYLLIDEEVHGWGRILTFCDNLNAPVLGAEYTALPEISWADPNWLIGIDDYITITVVGTTYYYSIDDGFWDCFDGCDCHRLWEFSVDEKGTVTLISYQEVGEWYCDFELP